MTLLKLLEKEKTIVFVSTADQANFISEVCSKFEARISEDSEREKFYKSPVMKIHGFME